LTFGAIVLLGYLLGSCPWGYWLVRIVRGEDVRRVGSGGIGASNVVRSYGFALGFPVVLLDVAKGFVPAFVGVHAVSPLCGIVAGAAAMAGHYRPLFLRFEKGGKMVATAGGVFLGVAAFAALSAAVVWLVVFALTRYTSVASIAAALSLPVWAIVLSYSPAVIVLSVVSAAAVIFLHRSNLRRLRSGTENRFWPRQRRTAPQ
jgi:acyl phosphate:glycerol-3-phosphate acyltransferase